MSERDRIVKELHDDLVKRRGGCKTDPCPVAVALAAAFDAGAAAEREAIAELVADMVHHRLAGTAFLVAKAIRARGETK